MLLSVGQPLAVLPAMFYQVLRRLTGRVGSIAWDCRWDGWSHGSVAWALYPPGMQSTLQYPIMPALFTLGTQESGREPTGNLQRLFHYWQCLSSSLHRSFPTPLPSVLLHISSCRVSCSGSAAGVRLLFSNLMHFSVKEYECPSRSSGLFVLCLEIG